MYKIFIIILIVLNNSFVLAANDTTNDKISKQLEKDLSHNKVVEVYLLLNNENTLNKSHSNDRLTRLKSTIKQLKHNAKISRKDIEPLISSLTKDYKFYWINNSVWVKLDSKYAKKLIASKYISKAISNKKHALQIVKDTSIIKSKKAIDWNIDLINAPQVWSQGFKGQNVIIAGQDTGYQWDHVSIKEKYAGWDGTTVDHNYNWHDAISTPVVPCLDGGNPVSCDDHGHGTHTMGTMVGDDGAGNQIGVAPDAKWIGCRNMDQGEGTPQTYTECFQFFLEPTDLNDANPDVTKAPHIINNSWGCPTTEGCSIDALETVVSNVVDAGILVVAAAGNSGSSCSTINTPIAIYSKTLTIGSTTSADNISSFSSRGGIAVDGSHRLKPDMSAPGSSIRSAQLGGTYVPMSGTSMASPHVAGVAALMISALPSLAGNPELITQILLESSQPKTSGQSCSGVAGSVSPNNTFGWGRLDALQAVNQATNISIFFNGFEDN